MEHETTNHLIHPFQRLPTHSGAEAGKEVALPVLNSSGVKAEAQKVKSSIGVFPSPLVVLAVHHLSLIRMEFKMTIGESAPQYL